MPCLDVRLNLLRSEAPTAVEMVLREALVHATPDELPQLCRALTVHDREVAVASVIRRLHDLSPDDQREICRRIPSLDAAGSAILARSHPQALTNLITAIHHRAKVSELSLLVPLLRREEVREAAGATLLWVVEQAVGRWGRAARSYADHTTLDRWVTRALVDYREHRQEPVLVAAALLAVQAGPELTELLKQPHHQSTFAFRRAPEHVRLPAVRRNLINWLGVDALVGPAARRLDALDGHQAFEDLLTGTHLLFNPRRRRAIRRVGRPSRCLPADDTAARLSARAQTGLPRFIRSLEFSSANRAQILADAVTLTSPAARLGVLRELQCSRHPAAQEAIATLCFDEAPAVAVLATRHALSWESPPVAQLESLATNGIDTRVRRRVTSAMADRDIPSFFTHWMRLRPGNRIVIARRLIQESRDEFANALINILTGRERDERLLAISLARRTGMVPLMEQDLIDQTTGCDARVVSAAVAALSDGLSPARVDALKARLRDQDSRVRANAIEAVAACHAPALIQLIEPSLRSPDNRPRANAIRELLRKTPVEGVRELRLMLEDPNPLHRISALWVARSDRESHARDDVRTLLHREQIHQIRERAASTLRIMELDESRRLDDGFPPDGEER